MGFFKKGSVESTTSDTPITTTRPADEMRENSRDGITFWSASTSDTPTAPDATTTIHGKK